MKAILATLATAALCCLAATPSLLAGELQPGDVGYQHGEYHAIYNKLYQEVNQNASKEPGDRNFQKEIFGPIYRELYNNGKCHCKWGSCRPTNIRPANGESETGYEVKVNGTWLPVPETSLHHENSLSPELWHKLMGNLPEGANGHVCAYKDKHQPGGWRIECTVLQLIG